MPKIKCRRCEAMVEVPLMPYDPDAPLPTMKTVRTGLMKAALARTGGHSVKAAVMIVVGRTTLYRWIKEAEDDNR